MVDAKTGRVQRRSVGIGTCKLSDSRTGRWPIRERKRINERLDVRRSRGARIERRHVIHGELRLRHAQPLVGKEKEGLVLEDWTAQDTPEIVLPLPWLRYACAIRKPVICIQVVVAKVFKSSAMKAISPRTSDQDNLASALAPVFG